MDKLSQSNEDYLEAIFELADGAMAPVRSVDLANKLNVSKASVNKAVSALKEKGYVDQPFYGDITLTQTGIEYGGAVLQRHHLLFRFLVDVLGVDEERARDEACEMEHAISDDTLNRWTAYLAQQGIAAK